MCLWLCPWSDSGRVCGVTVAVSVEWLSCSWVNFSFYLVSAKRLTEHDSDLTNEMAPITKSAYARVLHLDITHFRVILLVGAVIRMAASNDLIEFHNDCFRNFRNFKCSILGILDRLNGHRNNSLGYQLSIKCSKERLCPTIARVMENPVMKCLLVSQKVKGLFS